MDNNLLFEEYIAEATRNKKYKPTKDDIINALKGRYLVGVMYEDETEPNVESGFRLIEPYAFGNGFVVPSTGVVKYPNRLYLRAFVIMDTDTDPVLSQRKKKIQSFPSVSRTEKTPYWRLMRFDRIKDFRILKRKFWNYREGYNPDDKMISNILYSIPITDFRGIAPKS